MARVRHQLDIKPLHLQSGYERIRDCDQTQPTLSTSLATRAAKRYDARASSTRYELHCICSQTMQAYRIANLRSPFYQHHLQSQLRKDMARVHPQLDNKPLHLQSGYARIKDCDDTQPILSTSTAIRTAKRYDARASSTRRQPIAFAIRLCKNKGL